MDGSAEGQFETLIGSTCIVMHILYEDRKQPAAEESEMPLGL